MGLKPLVACLVLASLAFAGCSDKGDGTDDGTDPSSSSSTGASLANRAPTALLNASVSDGTAPLNVTFTLDGSDADKDPLAWTLVFGDGNQTNGTGLPANVTRAFQAGNFSVGLIVTDGLLNATARLNLTVAAGGGAVSAVPLLHAEGAAALPCPACPAQYNVCATMVAGVNEGQCFYLDVPAEAAGRNGVFANSAGTISADFMSACDGTGDGLDYFAEQASPHEFEVPDGTACIVLYDSQNPGGAFTVDIL